MMMYGDVLTLHVLMQSLFDTSTGAPCEFVSVGALAA